jgi:hypothetical protein
MSWLFLCLCLRKKEFAYFAFKIHKNMSGYSHSIVNTIHHFSEIIIFKWTTFDLNQKI